ncbi:type II toxin-antitoxin system HipA family toxin [Cupriavidus agavae]|uniref:Serine/threonine-protein kinase HipA n=1 Tax=Cupriavidus agavae TaxID=1001822 RepID=A0A4Q7RPK9_9BURK|nr:type II toxin-antitoxin system HipA family toxin [Cupriavidus agavae]RZT35553.1 serine/threonine-protein kinase HipA [Cupriavidus agavae]
MDTPKKPAAPVRKRAARIVRPAPGVVASAQVLWCERPVGTVTEFDSGRIGFNYDPEYLGTGGPSLSPEFLPAESGTFEFPELRRVESFLGLPGALADALPDTFGNLIIKRYFAERGEPDKAMSPVQRLLYIGDRAMGALEFRPRIDRLATAGEAEALEVGSLVEAARKIVSGEEDGAISELMRIGASAGGARAKALILWDRDKRQIRSAFAKPRTGEQSWLIKFGGVESANPKDHQAQPFNRVEYTYALLTKALGIDMAPVDFIEDELGRFHFLTKRFDRPDDGSRIYMHSLAGLAHVDYNIPRAYSYDQYFRWILRLEMPHTAIEEAYRRMIFNVVGRNQDDHVKNFAFLMSPAGEWRLSPAYDLTFSAGTGYTLQHQMTIGGKSDDFAVEDLVAFGKAYGVINPKAVIARTVEAFSGWAALARDWNVAPNEIAARASRLRLFKV